MSELAGDVEAGARVDRLALMVTDASSPALVVVATLVAVSWHSADSVAQAAAVVATSVFFIAVVPYAYLLWRLRQRTAGDRHVQIRSQRLPLLMVGLLSTAVGVVGLVSIGAPRDLLALAGADVAGLAVVSILTRRWKISMHTAVAGGAAVIALLVFGPPAALLLLLLPLIGWARQRLRHHSMSEVLAGLAIGGSVAGVVFPLLR